MSTPIPMDLFSRIMVEAFNELMILRGSTFFMSIFGDPMAGGSKTIFSPDANVVDIDILRGSEKLAAMIPRGITTRITGGQKNTLSEKSTAFSRKFPLIEEEGDINAAQLVNRLAGENPYKISTQQERAMVIGVNNFEEHVRKILRTYEFLARESALTGKMPAILGTTNPDLIYDFRRNANNTITPVVKWDNASADIFGDLDTAVLTARENGKVTPDTCIVGRDAMKAYMKDSEVRATADNRRFEAVQVGVPSALSARHQRFVDSGAIFMGKLLLPSGNMLWMFTYPEIYENDAGVTQHYMPVDQVFVFASLARADRYFGPSERLPVTSAKRQWMLEVFGIDDSGLPVPPNINVSNQVVSPAMFMPDAYEGLGGKTITVRTQAAPIFASTQTDSFVTLIDTLT